MAFNALHTGIEALVNALLLTTPCGEINIVLSPNHTIDETEQVMHLGSLQIECTKPLDTSTPDGTEHIVIVSASIPTQRTDGTPLSCDIKTFSARLSGVLPGTLVADTFVCDADAVCSKPSEEITIEIK